MTELHFDQNGNLTPFSKITTDLATFEKVFVTYFEKSTTRKTLFDNYLRYLETFSKEITPNFTQWINGSFVTQKENPRDIDFVSFITRKEYTDAGEKNIDSFLSFSYESERLDAFICEIYPEHDFLYQDYTLRHQKDWYNRFTKNRKNNINEAYFKGFIEIIF